MSPRTVAKSAKLFVWQAAYAVEVYDVVVVVVVTVVYNGSILVRSGDNVQRCNRLTVGNFVVDLTAK